MTIEKLKDWVKVIRENCEKTINCAWQEGNLEAWAFHRGKAEALGDFANVLTKVEQELTLKELTGFCKAHECENCPFSYLVCYEDGEIFAYKCNLSILPKFWGIYNIEKTIKEATTE